MSDDVKEQHGDGHRPPHTVVIFVDADEQHDGKHVERAGKWIVRELKAAVGVDPAKILAEITPHALKDLDDNAEIELHEGERFMSHARGGASS